MNGERPIEESLLDFVAEGLKQKIGAPSRVIMPGTIGAMIDRDPTYRQFLKEKRIDLNPYSGGKITDIMTFSESPEYLGIKLKPKQAEILWKFNHEMDDATGLSRWKEFVGMIGMRSGKTVMASVQEAYELYCLLMLDNPQEYYGLVPGQEIYLVNVAASETQSKDTVFAQLSARIENSLWFKRYIGYLKSFGRTWRNDYLFRRTELRLEFHDKHIICVSMNSNSLTNVGKTAKFVVFDEIAKFKTSEGKDSADEVYSSISRATQTFGWNGHVWSISSPLSDSDKIVDLSRIALKGEIKGMVGYVLPTWEFNPSITREDLEREYLKDPILADRDYGCNPPKSHEDFVSDPETMRGLIFHNRRPLITASRIVTMKGGGDGRERPYVQLASDGPMPRDRNYMRVGHGDPGLVDDSFTFGVGHLEYRNRSEGRQTVVYPVVVMDFMLEWKPILKDKSMVDFLNVAEWIKRLHDHFGLSHVSFDRWNSAHLIQELVDYGVMAEDLKFTDQGQYNHYITLRRLISCGQFESFNGDEKTFDQFKSLKLINGTRVDHPEHGKVTDKDRSDVWAAVAYKLTKDMLDEDYAPTDRAKPRFVKEGGLASPVSRLGRDSVAGTGRSDFGVMR